MSWCSDAPEDQAICLFGGLLDKPDVTLSLRNLLRITFEFQEVPGMSLTYQLSNLVYKRSLNKEP